MGLEIIKDPNIDLVKMPSPDYDAFKEAKDWTDRRALDSSNGDEVFLYKTAQKTPNGGIVIVPFWLMRSEAAKANVPPPPDPSHVYPQGEHPPMVKWRPMPIRDLKPTEMIMIDPLGTVTVLDSAKPDNLIGQAVALSQMVDLLKKISDRIEQMESELALLALK
jgi:hypothetical protein